MPFYLTDSLNSWCFYSIVDEYVDDLEGEKEEQEAFLTKIETIVDTYCALSESKIDALREICAEYFPEEIEKESPAFFKTVLNSIDYQKLHQDLFNWAIEMRQEQKEEEEEKEEEQEDPQPEAEKEKDEKCSCYLSCCCVEQAKKVVIIEARLTDVDKRADKLYDAYRANVNEMIALRACAKKIYDDMDADGNLFYDSKQKAERIARLTLPQLNDLD